MKTFTQISIFLICLFTLFSCQNNQREISKPDSIFEIDTMRKPAISMEDILNDSIPIWHLSQKEQRVRTQRMAKFKYYGDLKLRRSGPLSYSYRSRSGDTTVTEMHLGILNYRIREGGRYVHKIQYFNKNKEKIKEINLDDLNPYTSGKYKKLVFGYPSEEELEGIDTTGLLAPTNYRLTVDNAYQSNGYTAAYFDLYSFHVNEHLDGNFIGVETTIIIIDPDGNVKYQKRNPERKHGSYINDTGRFLCLYSKKDSFPDEFEIIDTQKDEVIYRELAKPKETLLSIRPIKTGLVRIAYETDRSHHKIQRYFDLENRIKYEAYLSDEEVKTAYAGFTSYWDVLQRISVDTISY